MHTAPYDSNITASDAVEAASVAQLSKPNLQLTSLFKHSVDTSANSPQDEPTERVDNSFIKHVHALLVTPSN